MTRFNEFAAELAEVYPWGSDAWVAELALLESANIADGASVSSYMRQHGVDLLTILNLAGPIVLCEVRFGPRGIFSFTEYGEPALVIVARDVDAETPVDLVAWSIANSSVFGTFLGAGAVLGADQVINPASYFGGRALQLHRCPLDWLKAGCTGAVVLSAHRARALLVRRLGRLLVENEGYARRLVRSCAPAVSADDVLLPMTTSAA